MPPARLWWACPPQASLGHSERSRPIFSSFFVPTKKLAGAVEESLFAFLRLEFLPVRRAVDKVSKVATISGKLSLLIIYQVVIFPMNSAVQPKFSTAPAAPPAETQSPRSIPVPASISPLFTSMNPSSPLSKEPTSRTFQNTYHHLYYHCLAASFAISCCFDLPASNVFSYIQALFQKMGRWGTPRLAIFARRVAPGVLFLLDCKPEMFAPRVYGSKRRMGNVLGQLCGYAQI